ncbi:MAG: beta galactosidase jelly roll domain-containing protein [Tepidisphaeraceae bacterium]
MLVYVMNMVLPSAAVAVSQEFGRHRTVLNAGWRFHRGDLEAAEASSFDDSEWNAVGLPHSFSLPYFLSPHFYVGFGWYRKHVNVTSDLAARRFTLEFEGAFQVAEVFVNGIAVGTHQGGYTSFAFDITAALKPGDNVIAVRVNNEWNARLAPRR